MFVLVSTQPWSHRTDTCGNAAGPGLDWNLWCYVLVWRGRNRDITKRWLSHLCSLPDQSLHILPWFVAQLCDPIPEESKQTWLINAKCHIGNKCQEFQAAALHLNSTFHFISATSENVLLNQSDMHGHSQQPCNMFLVVSQFEMSDTNKRKKHLVSHCTFQNSANTPFWSQFRTSNELLSLEKNRIMYSFTMGAESC